MRWCPLVTLLLLGCTPEEVIPDPVDTDERDGGSECDPPVRGLSYTITGRVTDGEGGAVADARVVLEDRVAPRRRLAEATTDVDGAFTLAADDVTHWPGCWLVASDYWVAATADDLYGERDVKRVLAEGAEADDFTVDLSGSPVVVAP